ncbi:MAG: CoA transferase [Myxococcota bacterium]
MDPSELERTFRLARLEPDPECLDALTVTGRDPALASRFHLGEAAACALGLSAAGAARIWTRRGGAPQSVRVDATAAASTLLGFVIQQSDREVDLARHTSPVTAFYRAGDGRSIHLHGGFRHLARGALEVLGCNETAESIAAAVAQRSAVEWEDCLAERGLCGAAVRTAEEWADHPQGRALAGAPAVEIVRTGDAPPEPWAPGAARPLDGVRVLDLTRVLAGPTCGRTLAMHGADVLRVGAAHLPSIEPFVIETGRGKRNAHLDLDDPADARRLRRLVSECDVFCQGYRSGALERRGLSVEELAALRPGIVTVSINCYGHEGPWRDRRGWEQLAQSAVGMAAAEGGEGPPRLAPAAATDYTTGYLAAYGVTRALARRAEEGGSWHVRASLCQTGQWLTRLGADRDPAAASGLGDVDALCVESLTAWGRLRHLATQVQMSRTPARWERPPSPLGAHAAEWLDR